LPELITHKQKIFINDNIFSANATNHCYQKIQAGFFWCIHRMVIRSPCLMIYPSRALSTNPDDGSHLKKTGSSAFPSDATAPSARHII
jgi:hypothetical protein